MIKKILVILAVIVLIVVSTTPALAQKPPQSNGNGNTTHDNHGNAASNKGGNQDTANPSVQNGNQSTKNGGNVTTAGSNSGQGFDEWGYNRTARIFNGTGLSWCAEKGISEADCSLYVGSAVNDKLIMKWNAEWDRGNSEGWSKPPYDAWENNEWNGKFPGGSGEVWHYKIVWVWPCGADGTPLPDGGYCIWGQFEVIMEQGGSAGIHEMLTHAKPNGYGSYP